MTKILRDEYNEKQKTIIVLIVILLISIAGNIFVYAAIDHNDRITPAVLTEQNKPLATTFSFKNEKAINITFKEIIENGVDNDLFVYSGSNSNEYWFNKYSNLVAFYNNDENIQDTAISLAYKNKDVITKEQVVEAAKSFITNKLGENITGFTVKSCNYSQSDGYYSIELHKTYGKDGFISGEGCLVKVYASGKIKFYSFPDVIQFTDFDKAKISDITSEHLNKYVESIMIETYGESLSSFEISEVYLVKKNGEYVLSVLSAAHVEESISDDQSVTMTYAHEYFYEII